jgi:hypothetical protein
MRRHALVLCRFWTDPLAQSLQHQRNKEALLVAHYLQTCRGSHMSGLYPLYVGTLAEDLCLSTRPGREASGRAGIADRYPAGRQHLAPRGR